MCWFGNPLPSKVWRVGALNLGGYEVVSHSAGQGRTILASWRPSRFARASRYCSNILILLEWLLPFSELSSYSDEDLGDSELECSSLLVFIGDELSRSFRLPLHFLEGVLTFDLFFSFSSCDNICLRVLIDSCWGQIISSCSLWNRACSSNWLATSSGVLASKHRWFSLNWNSKTRIQWGRSTHHSPQFP